MTIEELNHLVSQPDSLNESTLPAIEKLLEAYPYSPSIVFLYLYNLALIRDIRYQTELQKWAIALPYREKLFALVEMQESLQGILSTQKEQESQDTLLVINKFLEENPEDLPPTDELIFDTPPSSKESYFDTLESPTPWNSENSAISASGAENTENNSFEEESDGDLLFSETLAGIYIKQGKYQKAYDMIKTLRLNFPEKSTYFALQLDFLTKLIDNDNFNKQ